MHKALLRHGAWLVFRPEATSPEQLQADLAQVSWAEYATERKRYAAARPNFTTAPAGGITATPSCSNASRTGWRLPRLVNVLLFP